MRGGKLDEIDLRLLALLQERGRDNFSALAAELGVSDATVHNRVKKLQETGHLRRFTVELGRERFGYSILACMGFNIHTGQVREVVGQLATLPNLYEVWMTTGTHNVTARAVFKDQAEIQSFTEKLHAIPGIQSYDFGIVVEETKTDPMVCHKLWQEQLKE